MIRLLFLFFVFIFLLLPTCYNFGELILNKLKITFNKYLSTFIGFIAIIAAFQIIYCPAMTLQLPSLYLTITGSILVVLLLILDFRNIKNIKIFYCDKYIWIMLAITCAIFFVYMRSMPYDLWHFDDAFYFPLMYENADTSKLFSVQPRSGEAISKISRLYTSQGYYLIGSYIISLYNIFKEFLSLKFNYMANVYYFMAFPSFLMLVMSAFGMARQMSSKTWKRVLFISLYIFSTVFLAIDSNLLNNMLMTGYIGVFIVLTVLVPFLLFLIFEYIKGKRKNVYLISLVFMAMLSYASFNIFIIFILLYSILAILYITKKEKHINDFAIMIFPALIFLINFVFSNNVISFIIQLVIILLYFLYYKFNYKILKIEEKIFKYLKYIVFAFAFIPIMLSIMLIVLKININCTTTEYLSTIVDALFPLFSNSSFHYSYVINTIFNLLFIVLILYLILFRKQKTNLYVLYISIIVGVFLNPFAIPFISTALTSETYNRIFVLIFNPFIYYYIIKFFLEKIDKKKLIILVCILFSLVCIAVQLKEFQYWVNIVGRSNKMYRLRNRDEIASRRLKNYALDNGIDEIRIATVHSDLKMLEPEIYSLLDRTLKYTPDETFTKQAYYISSLFFLSRGEIKQEYLQKYNENFSDVFEYLNINFITIDLKCPAKDSENFTSNVLCKKPLQKPEMLKSEYQDILEDYKEDKKIYDDVLKRLELVYQTDRYKLYHVKEGE